MTLQARIDRLISGAAKTGCLLNPKGGQVRKRIGAIRQALQQIPGILVCEGNDAITFKSAIEQLLQADIDLLVIVAGDGTTHAIFGHLFAARAPADWPLILIVPGGTTNMTPLDLGMQGKPEQIIQRLHVYLRKPSIPNLVQRPALRIEQDGMNPIYGMFFAVGLVARGVKFSRSPVKQIGITGGIFTFLIMLRSFIGMLANMILGRQQSDWAPVSMTLTEASGRIHRGTYLFALVDQQHKRLWRSLWPLLSGGGAVLQEKNGYYSHNTAALTLHMDDEYIVDGELYRSLDPQAPLTITATDAVTFLVL